MESPSEAGLHLLLDYRELLGKSSTVSAMRPAWEMGVLRKQNLSSRFSQSWHSWITIVDITCPRDRTVTFVSWRAKSHKHRVRTTLVQLFQDLGLIYLQDGHGVKGRSGLAHSVVSLGSKG